MLQSVLHLPHAAAGVVPSAVVALGALVAEVAVIAAVDQTVVIVAAIAAVPGTLAALGALALGLLNRRTAIEARIQSEAAAVAAVAAKEAAEASKTELIRTAEGIFTLGHRVDGVLDKLLIKTEAEGAVRGTATERVRQEDVAAAHAEGVAEGQRRGQDEHPEVAG